MIRFKAVIFLAATVLLCACGAETGNHDVDTQPDPEEVQAAKEVAEAILSKESDPEECGQGGTACPAGLECVTWGDGSQACGPEAVEGLVLISDATLGGSCLMANDIDKLPGASIASVQVIDTDGSVLGWGRMVWDEAGYEVAADRGIPPDGTPFTGDACAASYNLGCEGKAAFEIIDDSGRPQNFRAGQNLFIHIRGAEICGDPVEDGIEAAICTDLAAVNSGALDSCDWRVRLIELPEEQYGPDRFGGTLDI